jgi:rubrerythrin
VYDRCSALASLVVRSLSGEPTYFDVSGLAARVAERAGDGGLYRCRLCGRTVRLSHLKQHLRTRHCGELEELWSKLKPRRLPRSGGGGASYMPFLLYCRACGWSVLLRLPRNRGPPSLRDRLRELVGTVVPATCPNCGRAFDPSKLEPGFAGERELHRHPPPSTPQETP